MKKKFRDMIGEPGKRARRFVATIRRRRVNDKPVPVSRAVAVMEACARWPLGIVCVCMIGYFAIPYLMNSWADNSSFGDEPDTRKTVVSTIPLLAACDRSDSDQVIRLLDGGSDPNQADDEGDTPLHHLLVHSDSDQETEQESIIKALLAKGADPGTRNAQGESGLAFALRENQASRYVPLLLKRTGLVDLAPDKAGNTLMHMAAKSGVANNVATVLERIPGGIGLLDRSNDEGETPLMLAIDSQEGDGLLQVGDADQKQEHKRLLAGGNKAFRRLLASGADSQARNRVGDTVLMHLIDKGDHSDMVQVLKNGASPNQPDLDGSYPLQRAVANCDGMAAMILINAGADVYAKGSVGLTAAEFARVKQQVCFAEPQRSLLKMVVAHKR